MGMLHYNVVLHPAILPFIPVFLLIWGISFFFLFPKQKIEGFLCDLMWETTLPMIFPEAVILPSPMEWEHGSGKQDLQWSVSSPSSLSNYFFL